MRKTTTDNKKESRLLAIVMTVLTATGILSGSIAVPILCRQFYYAHITPLQMRLRVGLTEEQVRETYDEVLDYCLGMREDFRLTHLTWSAEGAAHFADVQKLFLMDLWVLAVSMLLLVLIWLAARYKNVQTADIKGHGSGFWAATGLGAAFAIVGGLAALDFDRAFTMFHTVFFPGKDNWLFDAETDPIIRMLPEVFFRNCALLVFALIIGACGALILMDRIQKKQRQ
ncbi:MAG: TIGR01906 family membrane protein [Firmicutes bacterium]|nr:TIGR01906 family membrane protein [Bacillota bacterium]